MRKPSRKQGLRAAVRIAATGHANAERIMAETAHNFSLAREAVRRSHKHLMLRIQDAQKEGAL